MFADTATYREVRSKAVEFGASAEPFTAWLTLRGVRTLPLRMRQHCENAQFLAERLAAHPAVSAVHHPGLASHPDHELGRKLLAGSGGVLSFDIRGGREAGRAVISAVRLATLAPSLGGTETLVLHPASTSHRQLDADQLHAAGIERAEDLWEDFAQALGR